jgi:hypothetical protein
MQMIGFLNESLKRRLSPRSDNQRHQSSKTILCIEEGCDTAALLTEECFVFPEGAAGENVAGVS